MGAATISLFEAGDTEALTRLLQAAALPVSDITPELCAGFLVARAGTEMIGVAGIEYHGADGLLRSMAVAGARRGTGLGTRLLTTMEARAAQHGVRRLYLLTTGAEAFFATHGYRTVSRESAPAAIRATAQFSELCPASSAFMLKELN